MKKYIVYKYYSDGYKIGYIKEVCTCDKCKERGRAEVFINDLNDEYLDCIRADRLDNIIYLGNSLDGAFDEIQNSFKTKIQALEKEKMYLQGLVDLYSELKEDKDNEFIIRVTPNTPIKTIAKYGDVKKDADLWRDEFILKTNLVFNDIKNLPFVLSIKSK